MTILSDLLDLAKAEAGKFSIKRSALNLRVLVERVRSSLQPAASAYGIELVLQDHPAVPKYVLVDPVRLSQCIANVISNAVKFVDLHHKGRPGAGRIVIRVEPEPRLEVVDRRLMPVGRRCRACRRVHPWCGHNRAFQRGPGEGGGSSRMLLRPRRVSPRRPAINNDRGDSRSGTEDDSDAVAQSFEFGEDRGRGSGDEYNPASDSDEDACSITSEAELLGDAVAIKEGEAGDAGATPGVLVETYKGFAEDAPYWDSTRVEVNAAQYGSHGWVKGYVPPSESPPPPAAAGAKRKKRSMRLQPASAILRDGGGPALRSALKKSKSAGSKRGGDASPSSGSDSARAIALVDEPVPRNAPTASISVGIAGALPAEGSPCAGASAIASASGSAAAAERGAAAGVEAAAAAARSGVSGHTATAGSEPGAVASSSPQSSLARTLQARASPMRHQQPPPDGAAAIDIPPQLLLPSAVRGGLAGPAAPPRRRAPRKVFYADHRANQLIQDEDGAWFATTGQSMVIRITVKDNGPGVPGHLVNTLFRAFTQLDAGTAYKGRSSGLGLAIVKEIVTQHDGRVGIASCEGQGTDIFLSIPMPVLERRPGGPHNSMRIARAEARRRTAARAERSPAAAAAGLDDEDDTELPEVPLPHPMNVFAGTVGVVEDFPRHPVEERWQAAQALKLGGGRPGGILRKVSAIPPDTDYRAFKDVVSIVGRPARQQVQAQASSQLPPASPPISNPFLRPAGSPSRYASGGGIAMGGGVRLGAASAGGFQSRALPPGQISAPPVSPLTGSGASSSGVRNSGVVRGGTSPPTSLREDFERLTGADGGAANPLSAVPPRFQTSVATPPPPQPGGAQAASPPLSAASQQRPVILGAIMRRGAVKSSLKDVVTARPPAAGAAVVSPGMGHSLAGDAAAVSSAVLRSSQAQSPPAGGSDSSSGINSGGSAEGGSRSLRVATSGTGAQSPVALALSPSSRSESESALGPASPGDAAPVSPTTATGALGVTADVAGSHPVRVLLVDDVKSNRFFMAVALRRLFPGGCETDEAEDGTEAVEAMRRNGVGHYDLVALDYEMPTPGPVAAATMRRMGYAGPIIGVTGNALDEDIEAFDAAGADVVLTKPVEHRTLRRVLVDRLRVGAL